MYIYTHTYIYIYIYNSWIETGYVMYRIRASRAHAVLRGWRNAAKRGGGGLLTEIPLPRIARQGAVYNFNKRINSTNAMTRV